MPIRPVPKPTSKKERKSAGKNLATPQKILDMKAAIAKQSKPTKEELEDAISDVPDETVKERNKRNRNFGKNTERTVAKLSGGQRTPMSGAIKNSNYNLTGDVEVKDASGRDFVKIEVKGTSTITPTGDKTYTIKKSVLDQATAEAEAVGEIGLTYLHWLNANYEADDYVIFKSNHFFRLLELAKIGAAVQNGLYKEPE